MTLRNRLSKAHPIWKVVVWLSIMLLLFILMMVGYTLYIHLTGNQSAMQLRIAQLVQSIVVFVLPPLLAVWCWSNRPAEWLGMQSASSGWQYVLAFVIMFIAQPGINMLATWNEGLHLPARFAEFEQYFLDMEAAAAELTDLIASSPTVGVLLLNLVVLALVPALGEELTFRGVMQTLMNGEETHRPSAQLSTRTHIAVWVTGIVFSLIHFQFYGFIPRMLIGVGLGYLMAWSGSIWVPMVAHLTNNALVVILYYTEEHTDLVFDALEHFGTGSTQWAGWLSLVLSVLLLWLFRNGVQQRS